jgi:EAL domain-containing protein (putative c-di-GMP-specific phosphodiesterase class I)
VAGLLIAGRDDGDLVATGSDALERSLDQAIGSADRDDGPPSAPVCLALAIDRMQPEGTVLDAAHQAQIRDLVGVSLRKALRGSDKVICRDGQFLVALCPPPQADLESRVSVAARLQGAAATPMRLGTQSLSPVISVGVAAWDTLLEGLETGDDPRPDGRTLIAAARSALAAAQASGAGSLRVYSGEMSRADRRRRTLAADADGALASGQIRPWFQPQLSTDTGKVSGFEALARWVHPDYGMISPAEFLPALEAAGLLPRFTDMILQQSLLALRDWDRAGLHVPSVAVNLSQLDLDDPRLADRILWQLDRYGLEPGRLTVEILETVVADDPGDAACRNISALASAGCGIDLDDFGTGHASITSLRRFPVGRLKIDRTFVRHVDRDPVQQQMVAAILSMAERLKLDTVGEGVETAAEHARLAELGCGHVQGYALGRPMPPEDTPAWFGRHLSQLPPLPEMGRRSG